MGKIGRLTALALTSLLMGFPGAYAQLLPQVSAPSNKPAVPPRSQIVVQTSPNAQIYLDDVFKGQASPKGRLVIDNPKAGDHALRVSLPKKKNFEQTITVVAGQATEVTATLPDLGGTVVIRTSPGAAVFLDDAGRGTSDAMGQLTIPDVPPGAHGLRVALAGKAEYRQKITVAAGKESAIAARLSDLGETVALQTSPGAAVFLDDSPRGTADAKGELTIADVPVGKHQLRVTALGKIEYRQEITVSAGQALKVAAALADLGGTLVVQTSPGAAVFLDDAARGTTDASGQLSIPAVSAGSHRLRITAPGKKDLQQEVTVSAEEQAKVDAPLADAGPTFGEARINAKDGLKYVWIPAGNFEMGCSPGDKQCSPLESPTHRLTISKGFWLGQTEVTVGAYKHFAEVTFRKMPPAPSFNKDWADQTMPIVQVNWDNADNYCRWAGGRLPSEAEWEYAARGGTTEGRYGTLEEVAWFNGNSESQTHPVGRKQPNPYGLFDVLGNVAEWVNDRYAENYYQVSPAQDPLGPTLGKQRVIRGRGWDDSEQTVRASQREFADPSGRFSDVGFRCGGDIFGP